MIALPSFGSSSFKLMAKGLVELHRLGQIGRDDTPEAESVRDALDAPWRVLNRTDKERAGWLSADLYSVSEPPAASALKEMPPQAQQQLIEASEAIQSQDWDRALELLRKWQEHIAPALLSYMRGTIWRNAGYPEVAAYFCEHAWETDPTNANYHELYLDAMSESDPVAAAKLAQQVLDDDMNHSPVVVALAAHIHFHHAGDVSDFDMETMCRELIPILERNASKIDNNGDEASRSEGFEMTVQTLGICYDRLGNSGAAIDSFSRGLSANPNSVALLVSRGILRYGRSSDAINDFEQAERLGSTLVWPYLFLAHHCLFTNRFDECRVMCERGLRMTGTESAKSQLEEWRAIAQAALGFPPDFVRTAFEAAVRWDPSNEFASRNLAAFEASLKVPPAQPNSTWEKKSEAAIRQFGIVERRFQSLQPAIVG